MAKMLRVARSRLAVPIYFRRSKCGVAQLNLRETRRLVSQEVRTTVGGAAAIGAAYTGVAGHKERDVIDRAGECFEHVIGRVREVCAGLVTSAVLDWYATVWSDGSMVLLIESGAINLASPAFAAFQRRIAESGTTAERRKLAAALRRGVAGIKRGRTANTRAADLDALRRMLPTIDEAVKAAREFDPDDTALNQFLRRVAPHIDVVQLRQRVRAAKRRHLAVELVVAAVLGVTRDVARAAIRRVRRANATRNRPHIS